jgi:replicative DNA helicase
MSDQKSRVKIEDDNDLAIAGRLSGDPEDGTVLVSDGPRVMTVRDVLSASEKRANTPRQRRVATTGSRKLDAITGGVRPRYTWVVQAETSWGKTSFCVALSDENLKRGGRVLIVSTEDAPELYGDRLLARRGNLNAEHVRDGTLNQDEIKRAQDVVIRAEAVPFYLFAIGKSSEWILKNLPVVVRAYSIDVVIVDYIQEIYSARRHENRRLEMASVARDLRACIKGLGISGIIVSQITNKTGEKPGKYSVRDSQDIVNGAEVVAVGYYTDKGQKDRDGNEIPEGSRAIKIDKNKDGPKCTVVLVWDEKSACFRDEPDHAYDHMTDLHERMERDGDFSDLDAPQPNYQDVDPDAIDGRYP